METKLLLSSKDILEKQFEKDVKGYNPDEVDDFLDTIIKDYKTFKEYKTECQNYISELEVQIRKLKEQIKDLEVQKSQLNQRASLIKEGNTVTAENVVLLQKIDAYEKALYAKGVNPKDIF